MVETVRAGLQTSGVLVRKLGSGPTDPDWAFGQAGYFGYRREVRELVSGRGRSHALS
jgi:hypothetical protein